jgi:hypothetical protein
MLTPLSFLLVFASLLTITAPVNAQTRAAAGALTGSIYPGAILVAPQREDYKAPAIYRSREAASRLEGLMAVKQICSEDTDALIKSRRFASRSTATSGWESSTLVSAEAAAGLDFIQKVDLNASAKYEYLAKIKTGPMQVWDSGNDDIGPTVIRYIGSVCKKLIQRRIQEGKIVFVAAEAVQAQEYEVQLERHAAGSLSGGGCRWWACAKAEVVARYDEKSQRSSLGKSVTIALVPAEISREKFITLADLGVDPSSPTSAFASNTTLRPKTYAGASRRSIQEAQQNSRANGREKERWVTAAIMPRAD